MRTTRRRTALIDVLHTSDRFLSARDLHLALSTRGDSLALSTVYRALQCLADDGEVDVFKGMDGETRYRRCDRTDQHGHLICRVCGRAEELGAETVTDRVAEYGRTLGFHNISAAAEFVGTCTWCAPSSGP